MDLEERLRAQWIESVQDWIGQDQSVRTDMLDSWMLDALGNLSGRRVLDIGCGEGRFCRLLAGLGAEVTGIDLTTAFVERARGLSNGTGKYLVGNAEDLNGVDDESFDLAVSYIVMVDLLRLRKLDQSGLSGPETRWPLHSVQLTPDTHVQPQRLDKTRRQEAVLSGRQLHRRRTA